MTPQEGNAERLSKGRVNHGARDQGQLQHVNKTIPNLPNRLRSASKGTFNGRRDAASFRSPKGPERAKIKAALDARCNKTSTILMNLSRDGGDTKHANLFKRSKLPDFNVGLYISSDTNNNKVNISDNLCSQVTFPWKPFLRLVQKILLLRCDIRH